MQIDHPSRPPLLGIRAIAADTGLEGWKVAVLARDGHAQIIRSLIVIEQRRRRLVAGQTVSVDQPRPR